MTMTGRNFLFTKTRYNNSFIGGVTNSVLVTAPFRSESLSDVSSAVGNRVSPLPQAFKTDRFNYYEGSYYSGTVGGGTWTEIVGPQSFAPTYGTANPIAVNNVYNEALSRLFDQLRGGVDIAMNAAEFKDTIRLKQSAEELETILRRNETQRIFKELRRQWGSRAWKLPMKAAGSAWLAFQFGIRPLLGQIYESIEAIKKAEPQFLTIVGKANANEIKAYTRLFPGDPDFVEVIKESWNVRYLIKCSFELKPSLATALAGYTTLNPVSLAWELQPFSFLVDYVYNIGGYLRSLETSYLYGTQFRKGFVTKGILLEADSSVNGERTSGGVVKRIAVKAQKRHAEKDRSVLDTIPIPRPPQFDVKLGPTRLLNCAALLTNLIKG